jgi:hypothetical protein
MGRRERRKIIGRKRTRKKEEFRSRNKRTIRKRMEEKHNENILAYQTKSNWHKGRSTKAIILGRSRK